MSINFCCIEFWPLLDCVDSLSVSNLTWWPLATPFPLVLGHKVKGMKMKPSVRPLAVIFILVLNVFNMWRDALSHSVLKCLLQVVRRSSWRNWSSKDGFVVQFKTKLSTWLAYHHKGPVDFFRNCIYAVRKIENF